jgi:hypothetical protein
MMTIDTVIQSLVVRASAVAQDFGRSAFVKAAVQSREHYKQTGLHITMDEFSGWVDALQANSKAQMPQCHV